MRFNAKVPRVRFWQFLNVALLSGLLMMVAFILFSPVDVIKNETWQLTVEGQQHYPGDILSVTSSYEKVRDVTGTARRYIECQNDRNAFVRYPINEAEANRTPAGKTGTGVLLPVPVNIPVPTDCKVSIEIQYDIYKVGDFVLRRHHEYIESKTFTLLPKPVGTPPSDSVSVEINNVPIDSSQPSKLPAASQQEQNNAQQGVNNSQQKTNNAAADANQKSVTSTEPGENCTVDLLGIKLFCN